MRIRSCLHIFPALKTEPFNDSSKKAGILGLFWQSAVTEFRPDPNNCHNSQCRFVSADLPSSRKHVTALMNRSTQEDDFVHSAGYSLKRFWDRATFGCWVVTAAAIGALAGLAFVFSSDPPEIQDMGAYRPISNTILYDDAGRPYASFALQHRIIAQYEDFPKVLYDAVLSIEDRNFEKHPGFELLRIVGAARRDLELGGSVQGASTLTMQLARNLFLSHERTYRRKIRELMLAIQIERRFTKPQIFALYANQIYLGHGVYGFETGARYYFGKPAKDLTLDEAAMLAALPKGPNIYSPIRDPHRALQRRNLVIDAMLAAKKIALPEAAAAKKRPLQLHIEDDSDSLAPYFVEEVRQYLEKRYGAEQVHEDGLRVYTTLDIDLQKAANNAVLDGLAAYERRHGWRARLHTAPATEITDEGRPSDLTSNVNVEAGNYYFAKVCPSPRPRHF